MPFKKVLILAFALWAGVSNFAYASARIECASMMSQSMGCCKDKTPCPCSIQAPSIERALPSDAQIHLQLLQAGLPSVSSDVVAPDRSFFEKNPFESPPQKPPLYTLFSVYRI